jgi:hypothetical protein
LYTHGDELLSVPLAGGTPESVVKGPTLTVGAPLLQALDGSYFYWDQDEPPIRDAGRMTSLWRIPRAGGTAVQLSVDPYVNDIALAENAVILVRGDGLADAVPYDGGGARVLTPHGNRVAGVDSTSVYWSQDSQAGDPPTVVSQLIRAAIDGGAVSPFFPDEPSRMASWKIWPDGDGGWVIVGLDSFDDGSYHTEIWLLDANRNARLVACDPRKGNDTGYISIRPAILPDAVYFLASYLQDDAAWTIVKVSR